MRPTLAALVVLLAALPARADITGPEKVTAKAGRLSTITLTHDCDWIDYAVLGEVVDGFREYDAEAKRIRLRVIGYEAGTGYVVAWGSKGGQPVPKHIVTITVTAGPSPVPPGPTPPTPPGPTPPGPTPPTPPQPDNPMPGVDGLHMLIVYDDKALATYPHEQVAAMNSGKVFDYLKSKGSANKWRVWQDDTNADGDEQKWRLAFNRKRDKLPWVIVSNGKTGFEGPMPANTDALLALLKKYGE